MTVETTTREAELLVHAKELRAAWDTTWTRLESLRREYQYHSAWNELVGKYADHPLLAQEVPWCGADLEQYILDMRELWTELWNTLGARAQRRGWCLTYESVVAQFGETGSRPGGIRGPSCNCDDCVAGHRTLLRQLELKRNRNRNAFHNLDLVPPRA